MQARISVQQRASPHPGAATCKQASQYSYVQASIPVQQSHHMPTDGQERHEVRAPATAALFVPESKGLNHRLETREDAKIFTDKLRVVDGKPVLLISSRWMPKQSSNYSLVVQSDVNASVENDAFDRQDRQPIA